MSVACVFSICSSVHRSCILQHIVRACSLALRNVTRTRCDAHKSLGLQNAHTARRESRALCIEHTHTRLLPNVSRSQPNSQRLETATTAAVSVPVAGRRFRSSSPFSQFGRNGSVVTFGDHVSRLYIGLPVSGFASLAIVFCSREKKNNIQVIFRCIIVGAIFVFA